MDMEKNDLLMISVVFLAVFALTFAFTTWINAQNVELYGFHVISSKPPVQELRALFNKTRPLILVQELTQAPSQANSAVASVTAELIYASAVTGVQVYNYGAVNGVPVNYTCNSNNSFCGVPDIRVSIDSTKAPCNCIVLNANDTMEIRGSPEFLLANAVNIRKVVFLAKSK